jgi:CheY-specific phosphatase CheX
LNLTEYIDILNKNLSVTFEKLFQTKVQFEGDFYQQNSTILPLEIQELKFNISSVALVSSSKMDVSVGFLFSKKDFLDFVSYLFGEKFEDWDESFKDLVGEWLNILLGRLKGPLNDEMGFDFSNTIPLVLEGENLSVRPIGQQPVHYFKITANLNDQKSEFFLFVVEGNEAVIPWDFMDLDLTTSSGGVN